MWLIIKYNTHSSSVHMAYWAVTCIVLHSSLPPRFLGHKSPCHSRSHQTIECTGHLACLISFAHRGFGFVDIGLTTKLHRVDAKNIQLMDGQIERNLAE